MTWWTCTPTRRIPTLQDMGTNVAGGFKMSHALARQLGPEVRDERAAAVGACSPSSYTPGGS